MSSTNETPVSINIHPGLLAAVDQAAAKRRPAAFAIDLGLKSDSAPSLSDMARRALMAEIMVEIVKQSDAKWFSAPLFDGSFIWFTDVDERAKSYEHLLSTNKGAAVEVCLPPALIGFAETEAQSSGKSVGDVVCRSLITYLVLDELIEEHGGLHQGT